MHPWIRLGIRFFPPWRFPDNLVRSNAGKAKLEHAATTATLLVLGFWPCTCRVMTLDSTNYDDPSYVTGNPLVLSG